MKFKIGDRVITCYGKNGKVKVASCISGESSYALKIKGEPCLIWYDENDLTLRPPKKEWGRDAVTDLPDSSRTVRIKFATGKKAWGFHANDGWYHRDAPGVSIDPPCPVIRDEVVRWKEEPYFWVDASSLPNHARRVRVELEDGRLRWGYYVQETAANSAGWRVYEHGKRGPVCLREKVVAYRPMPE